MGMVDTCHGFAAKGLINGTACWVIFACLASLVQHSFFVKETPKITREESRQLGRVVVWTSCICMWLFWSFVYMHQMVPLIYPVHTAESFSAASRESYSHSIAMDRGARA